MSGIPAHLLESMRQKLDGTPVELPPITLPQEVPLLPAGADQMGQVERAEVAVRLQDRWEGVGGVLHKHSPVGAC